MVGMLFKPQKGSIKMKRAFLAIAWGISSDTTSITGPYDTSQAARVHLEDVVRESQDNEKGAILGPFPIEYLDDEPEIAPALRVTSTDELHEALNSMIEHAVNTAGVDLHEVLSQVETDVGDWSENLEGKGGMPMTWTFARTLQDHFSAEAILALYEATPDAPANAGKRAVIRDAYRKVSGYEL
jgi:hypothetical protein